MQTAKNLLLWPGWDPVRKALEAWLTPQLALLWPKRRILKVYLNVVEFGPGLYGAEAARPGCGGQSGRRRCSHALAEFRLHGEPHGLREAADPEPRHHPRPVDLDRARAQPELPGDVLVRLPRHQQVQHLALARRERGDPLGGITG